MQPMPIEHGRPAGTGSGRPWSVLVLRSLVMQVHGRSSDALDERQLTGKAREVADSTRLTVTVYEVDASQPAPPAPGSSINPQALGWREAARITPTTYLETPMNAYTTIYIADSYAVGCPVHIRKPQVGYGLTRRQAIDACVPWPIHAAYFRREARPLILVDGNPAGAGEIHDALSVTEKSDEPVHKAIRTALQFMRYSEAMRLAVQCGLMVAPRRSPLKRKQTDRITKAFHVLPETAALLAAEAARTGENTSRIVDRLVSGLAPSPEKRAPGPEAPPSAEAMSGKSGAAGQRAHAQ